jgi:hypothetical protein
LIILMGYYGYGAMRAALWTTVHVHRLGVAFLYFKYLLKDPELEKETLPATCARSSRPMRR